MAFGIRPRRHRAKPGINRAVHTLFPARPRGQMGETDSGREEKQPGWDGRPPGLMPSPRMGDERLAQAAGEA